VTGTDAGRWWPRSKSGRHARRSHHSTAYRRVRQGAIFACLVVSRYQMITFLHPKLSHAAKGDIRALELS
jgi:hypothetical protein